MKMIERVERAIAAKSTAGVPWNQLASNFKLEFREQARAAIEAMREPTEEMTDMHPPFVNKQEFLASYRAMIDAALSRAL